MKKFENLKPGFEEAHQAMLDYVNHSKFPCVAAKAAVKTEKYGFGSYESMADIACAEELCEDLYNFIDQYGLKEMKESGDFEMTTYVAHFAGPTIEDQLSGAKIFEQLLMNLHNYDKAKHPWDSSVSNDIESVDFSFSIGGQAFFVPLIYQFSGSEARQTDGEIFCVFNPHVMFENLKKKNPKSFEKMKAKIRSLQSEVHPHLGDHGVVPAFVQYALVDPENLPEIEAIRTKTFGQCPFKNLNK